MSFIEMLQEFFFKAMAKGWAGNAPIFTIPQMPGYQAISFQENSLRLLDCYCVNPDSSKSAGTTTIWHEERPSWFMSYAGQYDKIVIPFLKEHLLMAYQGRRFYGGRGQDEHSDGTFFYKNELISNNFANFYGREEIFRRKTGDIMGYHDYWGMSLL